MQNGDIQEFECPVLNLNAQLALAGKLEQKISELKAQGTEVNITFPPLKVQRVWEEGAVYVRCPNRDRIHGTCALGGYCTY